MSTARSRQQQLGISCITDEPSQDPGQHALYFTLNEKGSYIPHKEIEDGRRRNRATLS